LSRDIYLLELFKELDSRQILTKSLKNNEILGLNLINLSMNELYFGFLKKGQPEGLGIIYDKFRVKKVGLFKQGLLDGLGKMQQDDYFLDGIWRNGEFIKGIFYEDQTLKYYFGSFFKNKCCNVEMEGLGFPIDLLSIDFLKVFFIYNFFYFLVSFKQNKHKNSLNFFNQTFKFFDLNFSKELFYKIIVKSHEEEQNSQKKIDDREQSPIRNENFFLKEPHDFKENLLSKSSCFQMSEEKKLGPNSNILALSHKINLVRSPIMNKKQEILLLPMEQFRNVHNFLLSASKKSNKIFEPMKTPDLPLYLKESNF